MAAKYAIVPESLMKRFDEAAPTSSPNTKLIAQEVTSNEWDEIVSLLPKQYKNRTRSLVSYLKKV